MAEWTPAAWCGKAALQMADWEDKESATAVLEKLTKLPPLVQPSEVDRLKKLVAEAGRGERFIVQGGDCSERFVDCEAERLKAQLHLILQMGLVIEQQTGGLPTTRICRIAGQYGKPRSKPKEVVEGMGEVMSFKGDNINGFDPKDRKWDPQRLLQGYFHSAATLNFLRSHVATVEPEVVGKIDLSALKLADEHEMVKAVQSIQKKVQSNDTPAAKASSTEFFTSHEAMQLDLEEALTRKVDTAYYNLGAHFVWIGDRTRQKDSAHVEYFRGISNPIGVKIGPSMKNDELKELLKILNPRKEEGRVMLITRYGAGKVKDMLTGHIQAVKDSGIPVTWQCDACHGNGIVADSNKYKTRRMEDMLQEIAQCAAVHKENGTILGGVHLEVSQGTVTECLGGAVGLKEEDLPTNYETYCDPRLNYAQSIESAFALAKELPKRAS